MIRNGVYRKTYIPREALDSLYNKDGKTLAEIGKIYGLSRERIRQLMREYEIPYLRPYRHSINKGYTDLNNIRYKTLTDYLAHQRRGDHAEILKQYYDENSLKCADCGTKDKLHFHHLCYPPIEPSDIVILCASCHSLRHRGKITRPQRYIIYEQFHNGVSQKELAKQYNVCTGTIAGIIHLVRHNLQTYKRLA